MEVFHQHQPQLPQVACFDTAFHRDMPRVAGPRAARGRLILAHLGNGASLAAVRNGKSIDTSMGFTPASGIPMSTRSGDLDPGLVWYLARTEHMTGKQFHEMVHRQSSLLGVSEISPDMRDLLAREAKDVRAAEAVALFCYQVKKWIGAFAAPSAGWTRSSSPAGLGKTPSRSVRGFATASNSWASGWTPGRTRRAHRSFPHGPVASRLGSSAPMRK
jgi:acetate kinase